MLAVAVALTALVCLVIFVNNKFPVEDPRYSVSVTAVAGLDALSSAPTISPVLNVTVHMDNTRDSGNGHCVPDLSTAEVSYGDAFLAKGTLPKICAGKRREAEGVGTGRGGAVVSTGPARRRDGGGRRCGGRPLEDAPVVVRLQGQGWRGSFPVLGASVLRLI